MATSRSSRAPLSSKAALRCRKKFLRFFPGGFRDETYVDWERGYKWEAHERWLASLGEREYRSLLMAGQFDEIARRAVSIESKTNLLFSFEKMALRDALKTDDGAQTFARGLYEFLHGRSEIERRFEKWCEVVGSLPRRQTRVLTWPIVTVFGFIAKPDEHMFLKPNVTRIAAREYDFEFAYASRPNWETYESLLTFAKTVGRDLADLKPRGMIDLQSFIWVQGSDEYDLARRETLSLRFIAQTVIRATPEQLFAFHELSDAFARLMPPWEKSRVIESAPNIHVGSRAIVDAYIAPGIFIRWESLHTAYDPPRSFEDQQTRGPFRSWRHRHIVEAHPGGALLTDDIEYKPPLGVLGRTVGKFIIERRLRRLFDYRHRVTKEYFERNG